MNTVNPAYDIAEGELSAALFMSIGLEKGLVCRASEWWAADAESLGELERLPESEVLYDEWHRDWELQIRSLPQSIVMVELRRNRGSASQVTADVLSHSRRAARLEVSRVRELVPAAEPKEWTGAHVGFWYNAARGGSAYIARKLEADSWSSTATNYPTATRRQLEPLMLDAARLTTGGRLVLWQGPPGTGKTSALRTLAREHRRELRVEYVIDPESFFGKSMSYFVEVVFAENAPTDRTRLLVLEDCDELLSADAKERAGQGLARLLNLVDGLIGQGLNLGVLITTNEPLGSFHAAISRPGRCAAIVSFDLFSVDEGARWLGDHPDKPLGKTSLADLFALKAGRQPMRRAQRIGFRTPAGKRD